MHRCIIPYCNKLKQLKIHKIFIGRKQKQQQQNSKNNHPIAASTTQTKQPLPNPVKDCVPMLSGRYKKDEETEKQKSNNVFPNPHYHRGEWLGLISGHFPHPSVLFSYLHVGKTLPITPNPQILELHKTAFRRLNYSNSTCIHFMKKEFQSQIVKMLIFIWLCSYIWF